MKGFVGSWTLVLLSLSVPTAGASTDRRLVEAAKNNQDAETLRALLKQGVDVNTPQPDGATALLWTAQWDRPNIAALLIRAGANVNAANDYGITPLSMACTNGSAEMVEMLLKAGANPNRALPTGETPLMTAARVGKLDTVNALLARGVDVNARESLRGQTALMWAVSERHLDVARTLLQQGADVRARSARGFTPLMFAARQGDLAAVEMLLAQGADVNETGSDGISVLHVATVRGHVALAQFLLDKGADPNAAGPGYTALHWAAWKSETALTRDYPVESGEWSVLVGLPTREGKLALIKALLAKGADVNAPLTKSPPRFGPFSAGRSGILTVHGGGSLAGATPFLLAAMVGDSEVMRVLVAYGADPRLTANEKTTPLMVAAGLGTDEEYTLVPMASRVEAVTLCLELGNEIDAANNAGNTALHATAFLGFDIIAQLLVDKGANVNPKNEKGETPLKIAEGFNENGMTLYVHKRTAELLRGLGATSH